jgi:glutamate synthase domain-containing protein 3
MIYIFCYNFYPKIYELGEPKKFHSTTQMESKNHAKLSNHSNTSKTQKFHQLIESLITQFNSSENRLISNFQNCLSEKKLEKLTNGIFPAKMKSISSSKTSEKYKFFKSFFRMICDLFVENFYRESIKIQKF